MNVKEHFEKFQEIVKKYNLKDPEKAEQISEYLLSQNNNTVSVDDFSEKFNINKKDSQIFISYIYKGIKFKEEYIDNK